MKVIVTTMSGDRLFGNYLGSPENIDELMATGMPVELHEVYSVVQMNMQIAPGVISRTTKLANPEFYPDFIPVKRCLIDSWYEPSSEVLEIIAKELEEVEKRKEDAENGVDPLEALQRQAAQAGPGIASVGPLPPGLMEKLRGGQ